MRRICLSLTSLTAFALLTGCGMQGKLPTLLALGAAVRGNVHGGQQPVAGARVYLFAAGTSGYGGASTSILNSSVSDTTSDSIGTYVLTDDDGGFTLPDDYICTPGQQLYLLAKGGNPGLGGTATNPALSLLTVVATCPSNGATGLASISVNIDEVTTAAMAYALSGFMVDPLHVSSGTSTESQLALNNAFLNISSLVNPASGAALAQTASGGVAPQAQLNTLGNILAACVNSDGTGYFCSTLFANAPAMPSGTVPGDTATAAVNIAHNQGAHAGTLWGLQSPTSPFSPALINQPTDLTLPVTFAPANFGANQLAVDAYGDVFFVGSGNNITELQSNGALAASTPFSPDSTVTSFSGITFEANGDFWVGINGSSAGAAIARFSPSFTLITRYNDVVANGISTGLPGNVFASDSSQNYVLGVDFPTSSSGVRFSRFLGNGVANPGPVASSSTGNLAIISSDGILSSFLPNQAENGYVTVGNGPAGVAIDSTDVAWVPNATDSTLTATQLTSASLTTNTFPTGIANPNSIVIDGNPNGAGVWYTTTAGLIGGAVAGTPVTTVGFSSGSGTPVAVAADPSGNLWTANGSSATQFIGLSVPVATPVLPGQLGALP